VGETSPKGVERHTRITSLTPRPDQKGSRREGDETVQKTWRNLEHHMRYLGKKEKIAGNRTLRDHELKRNMGF